MKKAHNDCVVLAYACALTGVLLLSALISVHAASFVFREASLRMTAGFLLIMVLVWIVLVTMSLTLFIDIFLGYFFGIDRIFEAKPNLSADGYLCSDEPSLAYQCCTLDAGKSQLKVGLYLQFTYSEILAYSKIMRRELKGTFNFAEMSFPIPLGDEVKLQVSRRMVKSILCEMQRRQYITLYWELKRDFLGEAVPSKDVYVSLRDIRRIRQAWPKDQPELIVDAGFNGKYKISEAHLQAWEQMLDEENEHISING